MCRFVDEKHIIYLLNINRMSAKRTILSCLCLVIACLVQAQDKMPQAISYQAVARDAQGKVVAEKQIGIKVEILKGSAEGAVVYSETHKPTSNQTGTINLLIGQGTSEIGTFSAIDWGGDTYFLQLSMDLEGGSSYEKVSTTQMLPVPYALYAAKAGEVEDKGGSSSSDEIVPYALNWINDCCIDIFDAVTGEMKVEKNGSLMLRGAFTYLNGKDQQLTIDFEGLPEGTTEKSRELGKSSVLGRFFDIEYRLSSSVSLPYEGAKIVIRNASNEIVKEYPFVMVEE